MRLIVCAAFVLSLAVPADAQAPMPFSAVRVVLYTPGTDTIAHTLPMDFGLLDARFILCDQAPQPGSSGPGINATKFQFDDPNRAGRACVLTFPPGPPSVPDGTYELALQGILGTVPPSLSSNRVTVIASAAGVVIKIPAGLVILQ